MANDNSSSSVNRFSTLGNLSRLSSSFLQRLAGRIICYKPKQLKTGQQSNNQQSENDRMADDEYHPSRWTSRELGGDQVGVFACSAKLIRSYERRHGEVLSMAAGPGGFLYTGSDSINIRVWMKGKPCGGFNAYDGPNYALLLDNQNQLFAANFDGRVRIWVQDNDIQSEDLSYTHIQTLPTLQDGFIEKFWRKRLKVIGMLDGMKWLSFPVTCISLSEDMRFLYSGSTDHTMKIFRLDDWKLIDCKEEHKQELTAIAADYGNLVFSSSKDGSIIMWERKGKANWKGVAHSRAQILLSGTDPVNALIMKHSATGTIELYAGLSNGKVMFWQERNSWSAPEVLSHHVKAVTCLARSPGPLVFSGSEDGKICAWRWELDSGIHTLVMMLIAHDGPVNCLAAHEDWEKKDDAGPCQCILYSSSRDKKVKTWLIADGAPEVLQHGR